MTDSIYDFTLTEMSGKPISLADYRGQVLLIVNTASKCGLAPQLTGLEDLYQRYGKDGLVVIGTPSNQFHQELKDGEDTVEYCQVHFGVTFPLTQLMHLNGKETHPLWQFLKQSTNSGAIKWNYTKFLVGRDGTVLKRFAPVTTPEKIEPAIQDALK
ncbi:glutathione peroxidase [Lacticaseibacillus hulanensis]|jgi:glutathione peroxidase|uniref:glutathione peroxidase n=1 Tax=Lacticaseibacillus hulanensis TaxID=2493111 RepID=UPI000FDAD073|nr:glutathione peroxidase [Lacticaseibacillus hulanensis]